MSSEWYYTTNKQQMGPVTWDELRELADVGILKPHDMVWTDGMSEWVKAINQSGLFSDETETAGTSKKSKYTEAKPPPGRRTRKRDDDVDDEEDEGKDKKKSRKREEERYKMGVGIRIALTLAGVALVLIVLAGCVVGMVWVAWPKSNPVAPVRDNWTWHNLGQAKHMEKEFRLMQGKRIVITVTNQLGNPNTNVDLMVFRGGEQNQAFAAFADRRLPNLDRNCRLEFVVPATDTYRVRVANFGPGMANACHVSVQEQ